MEKQPEKPIEFKYKTDIIAYLIRVPKNYGDLAINDIEYKYRQRVPKWLTSSNIKIIYFLYRSPVGELELDGSRYRPFEAMIPNIPVKYIIGEMVDCLVLGKSKDKEEEK
ncbi:MAG: hypothetical protein SV062_12480 [Thermodesulfobacteriota bacterium]|nr:hypothetical protein [Thermodesulfobacteriota bacterium]